METENTTCILLEEIRPGVYGGLLSMDSTQKYRLDIHTNGGDYALTRDQFNYWANLKKTTEYLGTIFDAQPSQLNNNIHCLSNPSEPVWWDNCVPLQHAKKNFYQQIRPFIL